MQTLAERVLRTIRKHGLIRPGDRVAAAVSGGADSVALLFLLLEMRAELGIVLSVAHVNHKLRGQDSDDDERFVAELARRHKLEFHCEQASLGPAPRAGIEAAARKLRYDFFRRLASEQRVSKIATAHTLDDQAETVLLRILRGTGVRGLSGIHPWLTLQERGSAAGHVVRPLLGFRRADLQAFLAERNQPWREDSSNRDVAFLRNRTRHEVLPLLTEKFGPTVVENLADLAEIARGEEEHWNVAHPETRVGRDSVDIASLLSLPLASQRRLVREWMESNAAGLSVSFRFIEEVLELAHGPASRRLELPGGHVLRRTQRELCLELASAEPATDYEYRLSVPGQVEVPELGVRVEAALVDPTNVPEAERGCLLGPARLPKELVIRNWRAGDRFWPAYTKAPKKVKELLGDRRISGERKKLWPVAVADGIGLVWMRAFAAPADLQPVDGATLAVWIREIATG